MSELGEDAAAPWQDAATNGGGSDEAARCAGAPELKERIMAGLSTIGDLARIALSVITSLAALMFLVLVFVEWRTVRTLVEPLQVPAALSRHGSDTRGHELDPAGPHLGRHRLRPHPLATRLDRSRLGHDRPEHPPARHLRSVAGRPGEDACGARPTCA